MKVLQQEKEQVERSSREREHNVQERCNGIQRDVDRLNNLSKSIDQYISENRETALAEAERQLRDIQQQMNVYSDRESVLCEQFEQLKVTNVCCMYFLTNS